MARSNDKSESIHKLFNAGAEITGAAVGGAIASSLIAGPVGGAVGGAVGPAITHILKLAVEVTQRTLGHREEVRIGATLTFAAAKIQENIDLGQQIRQDGFFLEQPGERAAAEEILEGIILVAKREHEEKKLRFYGNLVANIAFRLDIDRAQANLLIRLGESISYRQMCLLAIFSRVDKSSLRQEDYRDYRNISEATMALLQEISDLYSKRLLDFPVERLVVSKPLLGLEDFKPGSIYVQGIGTTLYNLMELGTIEPRDLEEVASLLSDSKCPPLPPQIQVSGLPQTHIPH